MIACLLFLLAFAAVVFLVASVKPSSAAGRLLARAAGEGWKYLLSWLAVLSLVTTPAMANPCVRCVPRARIVVQKQVLVKEKVVAVQVPVFVVPSYGATYIPPPPVLIQQGSTTVGQQAVSYTQQQVTAAQVQAAAVAPVQAAPVAAPMPQCVSSDRLAEVMLLIHQRMCAIEGKVGIGPAPAPQPQPVQPPQPQPQPAPAPAPGPQKPGLPAAFANKCSQCHTGPQSKGTFQLFSAPGQLAQLSDRQLRLVQSKCYTGQMPPPNNDKGIQPLTDQEVGEVIGWAASQK